MDNNIEIQNKRYKTYLIAFFVILALPLLAAPPMFHPAAWGKAIVFRIIIASLVFFLIWQIIAEKVKVNFKNLLNKKNKIFWPLWLLIALWTVFLLATIFSLDPFYSFWESPYRAGGFLNFSLYIIFAILAFLIIKEKHWQKIWKFCLIIGVLASIMAVLQYFQVFSKQLIPYTGRPPASFGNSIFLAIYLLFLLFFALSFGLREKKYKNKILYFSIILLFIFVFLIVKSRAIYLGLLFGFLYFFLFYFSKKASKKLLYLKIIAGLALILVIFGFYFINTRDQLPEFIENNKTLKTAASRLSLELLLEESRFPAWKVGLKAIKEKPILGWGPENFSIAFDKHYDPSFSNLPRTWWDRAHNFMLEISVEAGIPALIIYLSLFAVLFWQLQKIKKKNPSDALICHSIQASFIAYLTTTFFSFDSFSTYLILFLLIAYSLFLIRKNKFTDELTDVGRPQVCGRRTSVNNNSPLWKSGFIFGLFCILVIFIWFAGLKPLGANKEVNWADYYSKNGQCEKAIEKIDQVISKHSIIDAYARLQYVDIVRICLEENIERKYALAPKAVSVLEELTELRPYYTRTWITLGSYLNILIENSEALKIENVKELEKQADLVFQKAHELSPKREEVFLRWIEANFLSQKYQEAKEKAQQCIDLNSNLAFCWWKKALAHIYLYEFEQADQAIAIAAEKGQDLESGKSLFRLHKAYLKALESTEDEKLQIMSYQRLVDVYINLSLYVDRDNFQYHASAAHIYKILGEYTKAREQTIMILRDSEDLQENVKEFLNLIFSLDNNYFEHYFSLAWFYLELNQPQKAFEYALKAKNLAPERETVKEKEVVRMLEHDIWRFIKKLPSF